MAEKNARIRLHGICVFREVTLGDCSTIHFCHVLVWKAGHSTSHPIIVHILEHVHRIHLFCNM